MTQPKSLTLLQDMKQSASRSIIYQNTLAFINVCCQIDWTDTANTSLLNYRKSSQKYRDKARYTQLSEVVLHGYASKGNLQKIASILKILKEDQIHMTPQIYAAVFECIGRQSDAQQAMKLSRRYKTEAESNVTTQTNSTQPSLV